MVFNLIAVILGKVFIGRLLIIEIPGISYPVLTLWFFNVNKIKQNFKNQVDKAVII
jgi:hypothetical protein